MQTAGIVGAGITGRLLAVELADRGWRVSLYDRDTEAGRNSCTYAGAGMLAPSCELETAERDIAVLGNASMKLWPDWIERLGNTIFFKQAGSMVVAHPNDADELDRLKRKVRAKSMLPHPVKEISSDEINRLERHLNTAFTAGLFFEQEAHIDNRSLLEALRLRLHASDITWITETKVIRIEPHVIHTATETSHHDWVIDCRGLGAQHDLPDLRGVRGELIYVHALEVHLQRPIRLMHPRYPLYIVPRADQTFVIGATTIESEDYSSITVRSTLELLSAAYTVHTGFAEAHIMETCAQCRPAFPDNRPRIYHRDGLMRINGLYRHGFLLAPILIQCAGDYLEAKKTVPEAAKNIMQEMAA